MQPLKSVEQNANYFRRKQRLKHFVVVERRRAETVMKYAFVRNGHEPLFGAMTDWKNCAAALKRWQGLAASSGIQNTAALQTTSKHIATS
jgi:hypothetical protein